MPQTTLQGTLVRWTAAAAISIAATGLACDRYPTRPGHPVVGSAPPRIEISGPATVAPDGTVPFTATAFDNGAGHDVTATAIWSTSDRGVVTVSDTGVATGVAPGDAMISAALDTRVALKPVIVLPAGTFRVLGSVREAGVGLPVAGARVEAREGETIVLQTTSGADGRFRLYGVPAHADLRITRDGYVAATQTLNLADHSSVSIDLALSAPRPDVSGTYTLTVGSDRCSNTAVLLAPELRRRSYRADVTQNGAQLTVRLSGAPFRPIRGEPANQFSGTLDSSGARFQLAAPGYYYGYSNFSPEPDVVEEFPDGIALLISGSAVTSLSAQGLTGTLDGALESYRGPIATTAPTGRCRSTTHPFALTR